MKKLVRPLQDAMHASYERLTFFRSPRGRSTKIRKYEHVDLSKEFQVRAAQREMKKQKRLEDLYNLHDIKALGLKDVVKFEDPLMKLKAKDRDQLTPEELEALEAREQAERQLMAELKKDRDDIIAEFDEDTDLTKKIVIEGIKKICVLGVIKHHQIRHSVFDEIHYHPETLKGLETLHYHVEHNLPIEKELVFKMVPELFVHEINKLDWEDRKRFEKPKLTFMRADGEFLDVDVRDNLRINKLSKMEQLFDKAMRMDLYLSQQSMDLYNFYYDNLHNEVLHGGHQGMEEYLMQLEVMDEENMKDWERRMMAEIHELRMIDEDIKALRAHIQIKSKEIVLPEWIQDPQLKAEAYQMLKFAEKFQTVDITQTVMLPLPIFKKPDFEERLREVVDVDKIIEEDNKLLKDLANKRIPLPGKDLGEKDMNLVEKMNLLSKAVEVDEVPMFGIDINEEYTIEEELRKGLPADQRILVDEIYKILHFNNRDPETYTVSFWADYFKIPAPVVRNVVNYLAYPVVDDRSKNVKFVLTFQDTELAKSAQHLIGKLDRDTYFEFLELDYYRRMQDEYGDEIGLYGSMEPPKGVDQQMIEATREGAAQVLPSFVEKQIHDIISSDNIMSEIDEEIKKLSEGEKDSAAKKKNLKAVDRQK